MGGRTASFQDGLPWSESCRADRRHGAKRADRVRSALGARCSGRDTTRSYKKCRDAVARKEVKAMLVVAAKAKRKAGFRRATMTSARPQPRNTCWHLHVR